MMTPPPSPSRAPPLLPPSWAPAGILNTSTLGASFGVVGGLAYASW